MKKDELEIRVEDLESDLRDRDEQVKALREELDAAMGLVDEMRDHTEASNEMIDNWIEVFQMEQAGESSWKFDSGQHKLWAAHKELNEKYQKLLREWNRFVPDYNRTVRQRYRGRPLEASPAQVDKVLKLRKTHASLRTIAAQTGLGVRTVRTITEKEKGTDRTSKRTNALRKREIDRLRMASWRTRKREYDNLPKKISQTRKRGDELVKAAKGLGG